MLKIRPSVRNLDLKEEEPDKLVTLIVEHLV
jgi:hypothetical protein